MLKQQFRFWIAVLVVIVLCLWLLGEILLPFIVGLALAYFLDPVADMFERAGVSRLVGTIIILAFSPVIIGLLMLLLLPALGDQIVAFAEKLPSFMNTLAKLFEEMAPDWMKDLLTKAGLEAPNSASEIAAKAAEWLGKLLGSIWFGGMALVNVLSLFVVTPIVIFYMLHDWDRIVAKIDQWLPRDHADTIREIARDADAAMAGFVRGQGTVCLILGTFYAIALILAGLNFGLLIGLAAGLLSFIPYVGSIFGGVLAIGMALVQFWPNWVDILIIVAIFAVGQFVEGNFLSPKLVGDRIGVHPVWLMFALFAFGYLFGFVGLLLAVPLAAAVGVICRFVLKRYLASELYLGSQEVSTAKAKPAKKAK